MIRNKPGFLKIFLKKHIPWIAWGVLIIVLVSIPDKQLPVVSESVDRFQPDKLVHVVLFMVFVFLLQRGFDIPYASGDALRSFYFATLLSGIILSGGTEIYQHFLIPGRTATLKDFLFSTLGSILGWIGYSSLRPAS